MRVQLGGATRSGRFTQGRDPISANLMRGARWVEWLLSRRDRLIVARHEVPGSAVWTFQEGETTRLTLREA